MHKLKYFFKRILFKISKRLLRFIFFFSVFSILLSSFCFGASNEYYVDTFGELIGNGCLRLFGGMDNTSEDFGSIYNNYDIVTVKDYVSGSLFNSFEVRIADNTLTGQVPAIAGSYKKNDVLVIGYNIEAITTDVGAIYYPNNELPSGFSTQLYTSNGVINLTAEQSLTEFKVVEANNKQYAQFTVYFEYRFLNDGNFNGLGHTFYQIFDEGEYQCQFNPVDNLDGYLFYLGDKDNAPLYPGFDSSSVDDVKDLEDNLINQYDGSTAWSDLVDGFSFEQFGIVNTFRVIIYMFDNIFRRIPHLKYIVDFSILLGLFAFALSIAQNLIGISNNISSSRYRASVRAEQSRNRAMQYAKNKAAFDYYKNKK